MSYLKYRNSCPKYIVEMFAIAFTVRMFANYFWTSAFSFLSIIVGKFTKLTPKEIHAKYATKLRINFM